MTSPSPSAPEGAVGAVSKGPDRKAELPSLSLLEVQSPSLSGTGDRVDSLSHEATTAFKAQSEERQFNGTASSEQFVTGMEPHGLTEHRTTFRDGATVEYADQLPRELKTGDGSSTRFEWEGGKLKGIQLQDGSRWQFADGKWQHSDPSGQVDGTADGLRFVNGGSTVIIRGPITEATIRPLTAGYLAPPELQGARQASPEAPAKAPQERTLTDRAGDQPVEIAPAGDTRAVADLVTRPASELSLAPETLTAAVESLRRSIGSRDSQAVEATLRSIPEQDKEQFEKLFKDSTKRDLRADLRRAGMDSAVFLLEPRQETRDAAWLQSNLDSLSRLGSGSTERALVEHNVRVSLRGMSEPERQALSQELQQKTGRNLEQTISGSGLSAPSKEIALLYARHGNSLSPEQLRQVADIALGANVGGEQKLLMFKEAFAGDSDAAKQARRQFLGDNGEGEARLREAFSSNEDFRQASDYARFGRLDTATFIDLQRSSIADNTKGVELVLHMMTPQQRQQFEQGQRLALSGKTEGANPAETESLRYYQRVRESLVRASSMSSIWDSTRQRTVTNWEDIAAHGEQTLVGRIATASGRDQVINAIKGFTPRDQELMRNPEYRKQVWDLIGGPPGSDESKVYSSSKLSGIETEAAREQMTKIFPGDLPPEASLAARHPTLAEAADDYVQFGKNEPFRPHGPSFTFEALMRARPEDYAALPGDRRRMLDARIDLMPEGAREAARAMLARLQSGQDVGAGAPEQVYLSRLQGASPQAIAESIVRLPEQARKEPRLEQAARFAFGDGFEKYGRSVLDGRGISAEHLLEMNTSRGVLWNSVDQANYFKGLKLIPADQRQSIIENADRARSNDPQAQAFLDSTFRGLTREQREVAINVLRRPNQEFTLVDQIRARSLGATIDQQQLIDNFAKLPAGERLAAINDYGKSYNKFLPDELARNGDENQRRQVELSLPMSRGDLERSFRDSVRDSGFGLYGHTAVSEISIGEAQNQFQTQLIENLPPEKRQEMAEKIDLAFQKYVKALRENSEAKDQYARDLSDTIMFAAGFAVGGLPVGTTLARVALTTATAVAARSGTQHLIKGDLSRGDITEAAILGVVDGATLARGSAFKGIFQKSVGNVLERHGAGGAESVARSVESGFESYMKRGEVARPEFEAHLADRLRKTGVRDPEAAAREILESYRKDAAMPRLNAAFAEVPGSREIAQDLLKYGRKDSLQSAVERGLISQEQADRLNRTSLEKLTSFAENPATRTRDLDDMRRLSDNLRFITEGTTGPEHTRAFADLVLMAGARRDLPIPFEALRGADPRVLGFYRDQMSGVANRFSRPGADAVAGTRYEYAMQREIMDAISQSNNPELKNWVFVPGTKGSTADHAGLDGALINIKDGRILPVDLKNYTPTGGWEKSDRFATHIPGRSPGVNFDHRSNYDLRTGRLVDGVRPSGEAVESHLVDLIRNRPASMIKPETFAELNPASRVHFPSLSDSPAPGDLAGLEAQAARIREFVRQAEQGGSNANLTLLRERLVNPRNGNGGLRFVEREIAALRGAQPVAPPVSEVQRLRSIDPTVTEAEARKIASLRQQLSSGRPASEIPDDRALIGAQRAFDRLGVKPTEADLAALLRARTPEDFERVARDSMVDRMKDVLGKLGSSQKPGDAGLAQWAELFFNRQAGEIDRDMLSEIARDSHESQTLREVLNRLYQSYPEKTRKALVDRAVDRIATVQ